ncbi:hypothetical protein C2W64_00947 [Brevibacillus laterosporus]|nr:hypothetical protein C2W64_00947 [Brevibacillus laterosporus]
MTFMLLYPALNANGGRIYHLLHALKNMTEPLDVMLMSRL